MSTNLGAQAPTTTPPTACSTWTTSRPHYRIGKTTAVELVALGGFPTSVVPGMHRYPAAAIHADDHAVALAGTVADPATVHRWPRWPSPGRRPLAPGPSPGPHQPGVVAIALDKIP